MQESKAILKCDDWNKTEARLIIGLKKHLQKPYTYEMPQDTYVAVQNLIHYRKQNISLTELWDIPKNVWFLFHCQAAGNWSRGTAPWRLEIVQALAFIITGKEIPVNKLLIHNIHDLIFHTDNPEAKYLPQPFPGHLLKKYALAGDAVQCKMHLDLAKNPEKKRQDVLNIMLNKRLLQAAANLHNLCGGGLEKIERNILFSIWNNTPESDINEDFERIIVPLLMPRRDFSFQYVLKKCKERMRPALESGRIKGDDVIFENGEYVLTLSKCMHFFYEIRDEVKKISSFGRIESLITAAKIFVQWE